MLGSDSHFPDAAGDVGVPQFGLDVLRRQEILADEGAQALTELVLLLPDDRGVRDRQTQRVRNNAVTANQSASAPTMPASAAART